MWFVLCVWLVNHMRGGRQPRLCSIWEVLFCGWRGCGFGVFCLPCKQKNNKTYCAALDSLLRLFTGHCRTLLTCSPKIFNPKQESKRQEEKAEEQKHISANGVVGDLLFLQSRLGESCLTRMGLLRLADAATLGVRPSHCAMRCPQVSNTFEARSGGGETREVERERERESRERERKREGVCVCVRTLSLSFPSSSLLPSSSHYPSCSCI